MDGFFVNFMAWPFLEYAKSESITIDDIQDWVASSEKEPEEYSPYQHIEKLIELIEKPSSSPYPALYAGMERNPSTYGLISQISCMEKNIIDCYKTVAFYIPILGNLFSAEIEYDGVMLDFILDFHHINSKTTAFLSEFIIIGEMRVLQYFLACNEPFAEVRLGHDLRSGATLKGYESLLNCPVLFNQEDYRFRINTLKTPYPKISEKPILYAMLRKEADRLMARVAKQDNISAQTRKTIAARLHSGMVRIADVAAEMQLPMKALRRSLKTEGTGYTDLYNQVRMDRLQSLLEAGKSFKQASFELGFSDPRAFNQWFKSQNGCSPSEYRDRYFSKVT
ncbi:MAG: helix-turn-helix domain-containing protein [Endozoicomonas sp.]